MNMQYLKVFATDEQVERIKKTFNSPLMAMTNPDPPGPGVPHAVPMFLTPEQAAHACALEQGLPDFEGYYGIDLQTKEFIKAY